jgi:hypothetical protein
MIGKRTLDGVNISRSARTNHYLDVLDLIMAREKPAGDSDDEEIMCIDDAAADVGGVTTAGRKTIPTPSLLPPRKVGEKDKRSDEAEDPPISPKIRPSYSPSSHSPSRSPTKPKPAQSPSHSPASKSRQHNTNNQQPNGECVCVVVRGDITNKMFDIWRQKLQELDKSVSVISSFHPKARCIVMPSKLPSMQTLEAWSLHEAQEILCKPLVSKEWIVDSIKQRSILDFNRYKIAEKPITAVALAIGLEGDGSTSRTTSPVVRRPSAASSDVSPSKLIGNGGDLVTTNRDQRAANWAERNKDRFACAVSGTDAAKNYQNNKHITEVFDKLNELYELTGDDFRAKVYKQACGLLSTMEHISDINQVKGKRGIGKSLLDKIDEILETGHLQKLDTFNQNPKIMAVTELCKIWGIGVKTADVLMKKHNIMSIDDLEKRGKQYLNPQQLIGLERHRELMIRIPRAEIQKIESFVSEFAVR